MSGQSGLPSLELKNQCLKFLSNIKSKRDLFVPDIYQKSVDSKEKKKLEKILISTYYNNKI